MKLYDLLGLDRHRDNPLWIAGSGGKTSLMLQLAREAAQDGLRVAATTTTHIAAPLPEERIAPIVLPLDAPDDCAKIFPLLDNAWAAGKAVVIGREISRADQEYRSMPHVKLCAPGGEAALRAIAARCDLFLCEADGSKRLPVKFPNDTEPVLWQGEGKMLVVLGLSAIEKPLAECCHRFALAQERLEIAADARALPESLALLLTAGYARYHPQILLNQADDYERIAAGRALAMLLRKNGIARVDILSMHKRIIDNKGEMICW